jgi:hypothetical protein
MSSPGRCHGRLERANESMAICSASSSSEFHAFYTFYAFWNLNIFDNFIFTKVDSWIPSCKIRKGNVWDRILSGIASGSLESDDQLAWSEFLREAARHRLRFDPAGWESWPNRATIRRFSQQIGIPLQDDWKHHIYTPKFTLSDVPRLPLILGIPPGGTAIKTNNCWTSNAMHLGPFHTQALFPCQMLHNTISKALFLPQHQNPGGK